MKFFLEMKHWELFLMIFLPTALCLLFRIPFERLVIASIALFMMIVLQTWFFSIGYWANRRLPESRRSGTALFIIGLTIPVIYLVMVIIIYFPMLSSSTPPPPPTWMLPMHMASMAGIFYGIWFSARKLKSLLENEDADFMIFSNTFFLMWIFPLGIWLIQPDVNKLYYRLEQSPSQSNEG